MSSSRRRRDGARRVGVAKLIAVTGLGFRTGIVWLNVEIGGMVVVGSC